MSLLIYLNEDDWDAKRDGGILRAHNKNNNNLTDILPCGGRLVLFDSKRLEHEVTPTKRVRLALVGWFLENAVNQQSNQPPKADKQPWSASSPAPSFLPVSHSKRSSYEISICSLRSSNEVAITLSSLSKSVNIIVNCSESEGGRNSRVTSNFGPGTGQFPPLSSASSRDPSLLLLTSLSSLDSVAFANGLPPLIYDLSNRGTIPILDVVGPKGRPSTNMGATKKFVETCASVGRRMFPALRVMEVSGSGWFEVYDIDDVVEKVGTAATTKATKTATKAKIKCLGRAVGYRKVVYALLVSGMVVDDFVDSDDDDDGDQYEEELSTTVILICPPEQNPSKDDRKQKCPSISDLIDSLPEIFDHEIIIHFDRINESQATALSGSCKHVLVRRAPPPEGDIKIYPNSSAGLKECERRNRNCDVLFPFDNSSLFSAPCAIPPSLTTTTIICGPCSNKSCVGVTFNVRHNNCIDQTETTVCDNDYRENTAKDNSDEEISHEDNDKNNINSNDAQLQRLNELKRIFLGNELDPDANEIDLDDDEDATAQCCSAISAQSPLSITPPHPTLTFLGTGCATPSVYRSSCGHALRNSSNQLVALIDCGSGALSSLNIFGNGDLTHLDLIWLSHAHLDHYGGTASVLLEKYEQYLSISSINERKRKRDMSDRPFCPPIVIGSKRVLEFLSSTLNGTKLFIGRHHEEFSRDRNSSNSTSTSASRNDNECNNDNVKLPSWCRQLRSVRVDHGTCRDAYGLLVEFSLASETSNFKLCFSGDTRPNKTLVRACQEFEGVNLLIHEASFLDDDKEEDAHVKGHSTLSQAKAMAKECGLSDKCIFTHFSQRHSKDKGSRGTILADDGMRVVLNEKSIAALRLL